MIDEIDHAGEHLPFAGRYLDRDELRIEALFIIFERIGEMKRRRDPSC